MHTENMEANQFNEGPEHLDQDPAPTPSNGAVWGYSLLAVTLISFCSLGLAFLYFLIPDGSVWLYYATSMTLSLGVGVLAGDAVLHLLPQAYGVHSHDVLDPHDHDHDDDSNAFLWRGFVCLMAILGMFVIEKILQLYTGHAHGHAHAHGHCHVQTSAEESAAARCPATDHPADEECPAETPHVHCISHAEVSLDDASSIRAAKRQAALDDHTGSSIHSDHEHEHSASGVLASGSVTHHEPSHKKPSMIKPMGWLILFGDALHNFVDGLAVAASFHVSLGTGLGTSIAVFLHEVPHELADFAVMRRSGMSKKRIVFYCALSSLFAYVGMIVGVVALADPSAQAWVLAITAGVFLYIALADVIPELNAKRSSLFDICFEGFGMALGIIIMLLIALFGENIAV